MGAIPEAVLAPVESGEVPRLGDLLERLEELEGLLGEGELALDDPALLALHTP